MRRDLQNFHSSMNEIEKSKINRLRSFKFAFCFTDNNTYTSKDCSLVYGSCLMENFSLSLIFPVSYHWSYK